MDIRLTYCSLGSFQPAVLTHSSLASLQTLVLTSFSLLSFWTWLLYWCSLPFVSGTCSLVPSRLVSFQAVQNEYSSWNLPSFCIEEYDAYSAAPLGVELIVFSDLPTWCVIQAVPVECWSFMSSWTLTRDANTNIPHWKQEVDVISDPSTGRTKRPVLIGRGVLLLLGSFFIAQCGKCPHWCKIFMFSRTVLHGAQGNLPSWGAVDLFDLVLFFMTHKAIYLHLVKV